MSYNTFKQAAAVVVAAAGTLYAFPEAFNIFY